MVHRHWTHGHESRHLSITEQLGPQRKILQHARPSSHDAVRERFCPTLVERKIRLAVKVAVVPLQSGILMFHGALSGVRPLAFLDLCSNVKRLCRVYRIQAVC